MSNTYPKLHNAAWPGVVGKGEGSEPVIELDTMIDLTANAEIDGVTFDGIDLFLADPHTSIDIDDAGIRELADKIGSRGLEIGSLVAPVWGPAGGGSAFGSEEERKQFLVQVEKACNVAARLRQLGARPNGIVRIDTSGSVEDWSKDPEGANALSADTFSKACDIAEKYGERLAAEGEICWGGMHSWRQMVNLLEAVNRPDTLGFQADMAHTLLYLMGYNAPEDRLLPEDHDWADRSALEAGLKTVTDALRPWTIDFHVAQNDGTVFGSGTHDKTGRHCQVDDPNGRLDVTHDAGYWLRDSSGELTKKIRHICWDGCMFPNAVMTEPATSNAILGAMIKVREAHGWTE